MSIRNTLRTTAFVATVGASLGMAGVAHAALGDPSARDWIPAPAGTTAVITYFNSSADSHGTHVDASAIRPLTYFEFGGMTMQPEVILPYVRLTAAGRTVRGFGDPLVGWTIWPYADPESKLWIGYEPFVSVPIGRYNGSDAGFAIGEHRWSTIQDLALVKGIGESTFFTLEVEYQYYGDNDDYYGGTLDQNSSWRFFGFLSHNLTPNLYVGARLKYALEGRTKISGGMADGTVGNRNKVGEAALELTWQANDHNQFQAMYEHEFKNKYENRMHGIQFRYAYIF